MEMTPEQVIEKINTIIAEKTANNVSKADADALKSDLMELIGKNNNDSLKSTIAELDAKIEALKEAGIKNSVKNMPLSSLMAKKYEENLSQISELGKKGGIIDLEVKAVDTMTIGGNYSGGTVALSELEQGVTRIVRRKPFLRRLMNVGVTMSKYVTYIQQKLPEGGAGMTAEGALKSQADFNLVEANAVTQKITAFIKISKEMIDDLPFVQNEINTELMELIELELDAQLLSGDGTGNNLVGILENAIAFTAGTFALSIVTPNELDVLRVAIAQVEASNFLVNFIVMHPTDVAKFDVTKTTTGEYTQPMIYTDVNGVKRYNGIEIITNTGVTVGDFLVGDFSKANLRIREDVNMQVGFVNDDFTKNLMTILAEMRATAYVKSNHYNAFVAGTFSTAITALTKA